MAIFDGAWSETALISIAKYVAGGGTNVEFAAITETIDIDLGDKDIDFVSTLKGGRLIKRIPQAGTTITFEGYPTSIDSTGGSGVSQMFHAGTWDTTQPLDITSSRSRDIFRIAILLTDDATATSGAGAVASGANAIRLIFAHAYMTSMKPSFTDGILKFSFAFKVAPFNSQGIGLIHDQSVDGTTTLAALNTYNSTNYPPTGSTAYTW